MVVVDVEPVIGKEGAEVVKGRALGEREPEVAWSKG